MPRKCSVPGCRTNYKGEPSSSTFQFPKDENQRRIWETKIRRENFKATDNSCVCVKHFPETFIITEDTFKDEYGSIVTIKRKRPKLKPDAYPTIIGDIAPHLEEPVPKKRKTWDEREYEQLSAVMTDSLKTYEADQIKNRILSTENIIEYLECLKLDNDIKYIRHEEGVLLFCLNINPFPKIMSSVLIKSSLDFVLYKNDVQLSLSKYSDLGIMFNTVSEKVHLDKLILFCSNTCNAVVQEKDYLDNALYYLNIFKEMVEEAKFNKCSFLIEQIQLCNKSKYAVKFSSETYELAFKMFLSSPACYTAIRQANILTVPHPSSLHKTAKMLNPYSDCYSPLNSYLKCRINNLSDNEKLVSLLIDEIYIDAQLCFKGGKITGTSFNNSLPAKTAHVFFISSVFSKYKDVISILPVSSFSGKQLFDFASKLLIDLDQLGLKVISIITDNNSVNKTMFDCFSMHEYVKEAARNPANLDEPLFLIYDTVHLLKNIRNNWINVKELPILHYPDFTDRKVIRQANFNHLRKLHYLEKNNLVKFCRHLNVKSLHPSSIERQKVSLVLKIFNQENVACLEEFGPKHSTLNGWEDTANFINLVVKWWKIVNVKSPFKGLRYKDADLSEISSESQEQLQFLLKMNSWLSEWKILTFGKLYNGLSTRTFDALSQTCLKLFEMCKYIFHVNKPSFILLGKFQTDPLEERFSLYRQLSGANFHISLQQLLESEKKIQLKNLISIISSKNGLITIKDLSVDMKCSFPEADSDELIKFQSLSLMPIVDELEENVGPVLLYIAGYVVFKICQTIDCIQCKNILNYNEETLTVDYENNARFLVKLDRGSLKKPSLFTMKVTILCYKVFQQVVSKQYETIFLKCRNHLAIVISLCQAHINTLNIFCDEGESLSCSHSLSILIKKIVTIISKILLNNYIKKQNDGTPKTTQRKYKKFK